MKKSFLKRRESWVVSRESCVAFRAVRSFVSHFSPHGRSRFVLHLTPYTLHPTLFTTHANPSQSSIRNPQFSILNSQFSILILSFFILSFFHSFLSAQTTTLQVVTKSTERVFAFSETKKVQIQVERAEVDVNVWNRSEIKIMVELMAKHPDRAVASSDLESFKCTTEIVGNTVYVRNYVLLPKGAAKPQANLKARYRLFLPASCAVNIQNSFGKITVEGLDKEIQLKADFCAVILQNISGKIVLDAHFGTLQAENLNGNFALNTDRSDCQLKNIKGTCRIRADYGSIDIDTDKTLVKMDVKTNQTTLKYSPTFTAKTPQQP